MVLVGLAVDLAPVFAVLAWGWGAAPLVLLYWTENVIAGLMTIPRIVTAGARFGGYGVLAGVGMSAFFVFHYGLFCAVHGTFLMVFLAMSTDPSTINTAPMMDIPGMIQASFLSGLHFAWLVGLVFTWQVAVFVWEFILKGGWKTTNPMSEMFAPYARIVVLHFAIFAGAGALILLGEPMIGVLGLIVLRAVFGIVNNAKGDFRDQMTRFREQTPEQLERILQGRVEDRR